MADPQQKPKVVLLGGTGFIGSHLICYLNENSLVSSLYYLDNHKPFVSLLQKGKEKGIFRECPRRKRSVERNLRAIKEIEGKIDFVFDCWEGEREGEKEEQERRKRVVEVGLDVGRVCVEIGVKRYVVFSDGKIYGNSKDLKTEKSPCKPQTAFAQLKEEVENGLATIEGLDYVIVRPALPYGPHDVENYVFRQLQRNAISVKVQEQNIFLFKKTREIHTVHVHDIVRAIWHLKDHGRKGEVFNLSSGNTTKETIASLGEQLFGSQTKFLGSIMSKLILSQEGHLSEYNATLLKNWTEMVEADSHCSHLLKPCVVPREEISLWINLDGSKISKETGFNYLHPELTFHECLEMILVAENLKIFPQGLLVCPVGASIKGAKKS